MRHQPTNLMRRVLYVSEEELEMESLTSTQDIRLFFPENLILQSSSSETSISALDIRDDPLQPIKLGQMDSGLLDAVQLCIA